MRIVKILLVTIAVVVMGIAAFIYLEPEKAADLAIAADRRHSGLARKEMDLPGGLHFVYLEGGKGEPIMLLHGFGANKDHFTRVARFLTPQYRVIIPDLIGFGESSHPEKYDYTPAGQAKQLRLFVRALGINQNLHLGGSSMGGQIAMFYAAGNPSEVSSLWLLDPAGVQSAPKSEFQMILARTGQNPLMVQNEDEFMDAVRFTMQKPPYIPAPIVKMLAKERIANHELEKSIFAQIAKVSVEKEMVGILIPTLIVWGEKDRVLDAAGADILRKIIAGSQSTIMGDVGHLPMMEKPEACAGDYLLFRKFIASQGR